MHAPFQRSKVPTCAALACLALRPLLGTADARSAWASAAAGAKMLVLGFVDVANSTPVGNTERTPQRIP